MNLKYYLKLILNITVPAAGLLTAVLLLPKLLRFFLPFVLAYAVAFLANPPVTFLQKKIAIKRKHSSIVITALVLAAVIFALYFLLHLLMNGASFLIGNLPLYMERFSETSGALLEEVRVVLERFVPGAGQTLLDVSENVNTLLSELFSAAASSAPSFAGNAVRSVPNAFINALIFLLSAFCFLTEWDSIQSFLRQHAPKQLTSYLHYLRADVIGILQTWFLAQFKLMFVVFIVLSAGFLLLKVQYALPLAVLTALLDFLPAFGVGFILWPWALFALLKGEFLRAGFLLLLYLATQAVRQILQPKIMGDTMGLSPLWTLFFLFTGFRLYGIAGMLFAVPVGMLFLSVYRYGMFDGMISSAKELLRQIGRIIQDR